VFRTKVGNKLKLNFMESDVFDPGTEWTLEFYFLHMRVYVDQMK